MASIRIGNVTRALLATALLGLGVSANLSADDTEIYQSALAAGATGRPKVLIIFDNSGSMRTPVTQQPQPYDPNGSYANGGHSGRIYWSTNGQPPSSTGNNWFYASKNRCQSSMTPLADNGIFQGKARRWVRSNSQVYVTPPTDYVYNAGWEALGTSSSARDPLHVDCEADATLTPNPGNGTAPNGYPYLPPIELSANGVQYRQVDQEYAATVTTTPVPPGGILTNVNWGSSGYTFYSAHYMDYLDDSGSTVTTTRIAIAQNVVKDLIQINPSIDFGLATFNYNANGQSNHGGRIVNRILDPNDPILDPEDPNDRATHQANLLTTINTFSPTGWTPLCESTWEAYRYLAGISVDLGNNRRTSTDFPARDLNAESSLVYQSPAQECAYSYVILMTDGEPTYDRNRNNTIKNLVNASLDPGEVPSYTCGSYADGNGGMSESCLPYLAWYMRNKDIAPNTAGDQHAIVYTIGFTSSQTLLSDTAAAAKSTYYEATDQKGLIEAFQGAVLEILATDATFTSPSVAVDSFTRTQSRNDVFFSMFLPSETTDWRGNIKKLKVQIANGVAQLVDKTPAAAIDPSTGAILGTASTYWSSNDGGTVSKGGVGALLVSRGPTLRDIKTNSGTNGALEAFSGANLDAASYGYDLSHPSDPDGALYAFFGVTNQTEFNALIDWGWGYQVDTAGNRLGTRPWILADMLHSKPLVVNYGALSPGTLADPDLRIVVGTNSGFLHMFNNENGTEDWAFFPKELGPVLKQRADDATSADHVYGIDASPVLYSKDVGLDGTIDVLDGDKAYIYFGLRRGGSMYYGLDISDPDSPSFLWMIDGATAGFSELGQSWSTPVVTKIPGYYDVVNGRNVYKPVLIFGAGYDTNKDAGGLGTADAMGRGIFIVDATTGALVWSVTPGSNSLTNLYEAGLEHSVAATVSPLDSNGDELTDRVYFADTGGNVWRVDMPGNALPTTSQNTWRIVKLAALNGGTAATDRRFFNAPDIVRTGYGGQVFDAVLLGSGDRTNPNGTDVDNQFYMLRDEKVAPYFTAEPDATDPECTASPVEDFRCELPLSTSDLFDVTSNLIQAGTTAQQTAARAALVAANGWRLDLEDLGEKSLSRSITIDGKVYFGTFSPNAAITNACVPEPGTGRLYVVNLLTAGEVIDFNGDNNKERSWIVGALIPDTPSPHFGDDGEIRLLLPPGSGGGGAMSNPFLTGSSVPPPYGEYWYREEYQ